MPFAACAKLNKDELKARLQKIVIGKGRSYMDSWRSGERPVLVEAAGSRGARARGGRA